jgi:indole-3-acetate monooxygenase
MEQTISRKVQYLERQAAKAVAFDALLAAIEQRRADFDRLGHVPRDVVGLMKAAGIFRASTPRCFGGDAIPPHEFLDLIERIGMVDGSAAWVAAFGSANTYLAALPYETQRKMYSQSPDQVFAAGLYPVAKAERVDGGWRVSGRWKFASGCMGADWMGVGIQGVGPGRDGQPPPVMMAVCPAAEIEIVPSWDVVGMQGTGSHDTRVQDKTFADEWTCARGAPGVIDEPLYRYPTLAFQAQVHAAVNIGLARAALDLAIAAGGAAKIMPGAARLADRAYYRTQLAQSEAQWRSARLFFYDAARRAWDVIAAGDKIQPELGNELRLSATHAAHTSAEVVQAAYRITGISAIQKTHRLQQIVRDSMVVTQHASLNESTYEATGSFFAQVDAGLA